MKEIKNIVLTIFCLTIALHANADDKGKEIIKAFNEAKNAQVEVNIDLTNTKFNHLDSISFVEYMAGKENQSIAYVSKFFYLFRQKMVENLNSLKGQKKAQYTLEPNSNADFYLDIKMQEITENAGLQGELCIYTKGHKEKSPVYSFILKEGRWNSFEKLLYEAAENFAEQFVHKFKYSFSNVGKTFKKIK